MLCKRGRERQPAPLLARACLSFSGQRQNEAGPQARRRIFQAH